MADLSDVERMIGDWERNAAQKAQRYQQMQEQVAQISITESVAGGAVSVTVGSNGIPTGISMTDAVRKMSPDQIAANVLKAMQKAQSKFPARLQEIVAETVGDDETSRHIVDTAARSFPPPPEEDEPEPPAEAVREMRIGTAEEEEPPRPPEPVRRPAPPRRPDPRDDEDFGDRTFLRRD
ncbi:MAG TPA: YbaB/EbfC family nucleoid-associated protein [Amycolatopsis sp.]|uniref:YbaB/EbfC family nucleoid-associated protein n=1 Tax=Amycolatopsis sp. TaxID=37632 RepID=UPI002B4875E8|nr:YbaB/EbfC family nucleoid-associated protein [Amycolatopsis sp.]HKS44792.1 YbaB/EbfC family nucleoid-associated protein [Amycolatopsis sp.]